MSTHDEQIQAAISTATRVTATALHLHGPRGAGKSWWLGEAGAAPFVRLASTHLSALEYASLSDLRAHAVDPH